MSYTKLFHSILDSSIWQESHQTRIVWVTMLAMADQHGEVQAAVPGLAKRAGVTLQEAEEAISTLSAPDKYSRTLDHEGRRIANIDGGWEILNHAKYRHAASLEDRKEKAAERAKRFRDKNKPQVAQQPDAERDDTLRVTPHNAPVTLSDDKQKQKQMQKQKQKEDITPPNPLKGDLPGKPSEGEKPAKTKKERKPVQRNAVLDALIACCGGDPMATTRSAWTQAATALRDIKEVNPYVTPEDIKSKASTYRRLHPDWELTSSALAKHWGSLVERKTDLFDGEDWRKCL
jgi:hypothetical protein